MGLLSQLRVQTLDLGDYRGRAVDGIRAVVRLTRVSGAPVDLDAKVGRTAGGDDQLEVGGLGGDTAQHRPGSRRDVGPDARPVLLLVHTAARLAGTPPPTPPQGATPAQR